MGSSRLRSAWPLCLASLLCVAACAAFLSAPLAWDDHGTITLNHALARPIPAKALLTQDYYRFSSEQSWRPLATASYLAMIRAFGKSPLAMRGVHLALHLANGLLAALLLEALGLPAAAAFWGAALFLVHPAHVETLFCVSFNEEILCALGLLVMLWAHLRGRAAVAAAGFAAALLAKETGVVGLPLAAACDLLAARDGIRRKASAYAAYAATLAAYLWAHFGPLAGPGGIGEAYALVPTERALYAAQSLATAARVFVLPIRLR
ncbi:MAG: hypothetical protein HY077_16030, partial [Elusimicrobia bacterium]|nr:hypothetical protein [Elusimicrobiota bacterium]